MIEQTRVKLTEGAGAPLEAVANLLQAHIAANQVDCDEWEFAMRLGLLKGLGATETDLRYLLMLGYIEHRVETTKPQSGRRTFRRHANGCFEEASCLMVTPKGATWARKVLNGRLSAVTRPKAAAAHQQTGLPATPYYDHQHRVLFSGPVELHRFRRAAREMEAVLKVFQDLNWPERVKHPPLPSNVHTKSRQREIVRRLNRCQDPHLRLFREMRV